MFEKSVRKIVATVMSVLVLFFAATITLIYVLNYADMKRQSEERLERYVATYSLFDDSNGFFEPERKEQINERPFGYEFAFFYSVAFSENGDKIKTDGVKAGVVSETEITEKAKSVLVGNETSGTTGTLSFRVERKQGYTLVAFIDNSMMKGNLSVLLKYMLIVGGAAVVLFAIASYFIARKIVKPLKENDEKQKRFVSDAGHELKTPVSVINANAELLKREIGDNQWLSNIKYENERMSALIKDLLDLSRAESAAVVSQSVDMTRLVLGEILPFESVAFDKGLTIKEEIEEGVETYGNPTQLKQLVSILLDNAVRHGDGGEITVSLKKYKKNAVLYVENRGKEIPKEYADKIFERFYRMDESRSEGNHYGLGLAIAKAIADAHNGKISVKCENGKVRFTAVFGL